jgi:hypothetical protein
MQRPEEVKRRHEDGEAWIERLDRDALTIDDWSVLARLSMFHFWRLSRGQVSLSC